MKALSNAVLKVLGMLLLVAAVLKGRQLLTEPVANSDIWSYRPLLILTVELELALSIWLLSGMFKKAAWLAALVCFSFFSVITLYKAVTGATSCGCFGSVQVNPWITLFAIDLPAVLALSLFRPKPVMPPRILMRIRLRHKPVKALIRQLSTPLSSTTRFAVTVFLGAIVLGVTIPILAFNEPAKVTLSYEVLEPETWVGKELPIRKNIDIGNQLTEGKWIILLFRHNCPVCLAIYDKFEKMPNSFTERQDKRKRIALIEVPPYRQIGNNAKRPFFLGRLSDDRKWFVDSSLILLSDGIIQGAWSSASADLNAMLDCFIDIM
jgi:hypothetical protein